MTATVLATNLKSQDARIRKLPTTTEAQQMRMVLAHTLCQDVPWDPLATTIQLPQPMMVHVNSHLVWDAWMERLVTLMEMHSTTTNRNVNSHHSTMVAMAIASAM